MPILDQELSEINLKPSEAEAPCLDDVPDVPVVPFPSPTSQKPCYCGKRIGIYFGQSDFDDLQNVNEALRMVAQWIIEDVVGMYASLYSTAHGKPEKIERFDSKQLRTTFELPEDEKIWYFIEEGPTVRFEGNELYIFMEYRVPATLETHLLINRNSSD